MTKERVVVVPHPGEVFSFRWDRSVLPWRRTFGVAQMLSIEPEGGVVHVRVVSFDDEHPVAVGHLPIMADRLQADVSEVLRRGQVPQSSWRPINEWRELRLKDVAGAFTLRLGEAVNAAWETARDCNPSASLKSLAIESAFPTRDSSGAFRIVRAVCHERAAPEEGAANPSLDTSS